LLALRLGFGGQFWANRFKKEWKSCSDFDRDQAAVRQAAKEFQHLNNLTL
jgi:hypothetical protein